VLGLLLEKLAREHAQPTRVLPFLFLIEADNILFAPIYLFLIKVNDLLSTYLNFGGYNGS